MESPTKDGYEAGIMNRMPAHPYLSKSVKERQFMEAFVVGVIAERG